MKAIQQFQNDAQPNQDYIDEFFDPACVVLHKHAAVYYDMLINGTLVWTRGVARAGTDGIFTYINPDYLASLPNHSQRAFLLGHEVGHDVLRHPERFKFYKDRGFHSMRGTEVVPWIHKLGNIAGDEVINHDLVAHGLEPIEDGYLTPRFNRDMLVDEVYLTLWQEEQDKQEDEPEPLPDAPEPQPSNEPADDSDDMSDTSDDADEDGDDGDDDSDSQDGDSADEDGDDESGSDGDSDADEGDDGEDEGTGEGDGDSDDSDGAGGGSGSDPEPSDHGGFDDHFEPMYEGTPEEQADDAANDKGETQRKADQAMDNLEESEGGEGGGAGHSRGWEESGYRHSLETAASATDWRGELADVVTRAGDGGINNWAKINRRRYAVTGCITPTRKGTVNRMAVTVDQSYSVSRIAYANYINEFASLLDLMQPKSGCVVMFTNSRVTKTYEVMTGAELLDLEYPCGGGTKMSAAVDFLEENGLESDVHLCFTDGEFFGNMDEWNKLTEAGVVIVLDRHPDADTMRDMLACGIRYIVASDVELAA